MKKGPPPDPLTKTSNIILPLRSSLDSKEKRDKMLSLSKKLLRGKIKLKVFGKGFGEEPFFRKVFPNKSHRQCSKLLLVAIHIEIGGLQKNKPCNRKAFIQGWVVRFELTVFSATN